MAFASKRYNVNVQGVTIGTLSLSSAFDGYKVPVEKLQELIKAGDLVETQAQAVDQLLGSMFEAVEESKAEGSSDPVPF